MGQAQRQQADAEARGPAVNDPLLQPLQLKKLSLKNRIMSTSHACGLEVDGLPKEQYQRYHEEKAVGGIALTMFGGSSNVAVDSPSVFRQLYVGSDEIIPYLQQFSRRIHAHGAALMCQITHLGRRGEPYASNWLPTIAPSPLRETLHRSFPKEMDKHDIARVIEAYGQAARRCEEGGLDGIETLASGHLIGQFLSPATNLRTDEFGGSLENRCRFGLMVHEEIRRRTSADFLVGLRYTVDERGGDGLSFDDCVKIAKVFERSGCIDFFNAIFGRMDTEMGLVVDNMPGMASPIAPWLKPVGAFKQEVGLPVFHAARISDIATARYAVSEGLLDMAAMTRAHIADPHIVAKLSRGEAARIRPCVGATHCMSPHRPKCLHNPSSGREAELPHLLPAAARPGLKVTVVGGGPAGLEAARVAAERGHQVTLFEAANRLGGQVLLGAEASWRRDLIGVIDWRVQELEVLGVETHLNRFAEARDVLATNPDVVIVATGGTPDLEWIDGAEHCTSVWDALSGSAPLGDCILIYDGTGRHPAPHCAEHCAANGKATILAGLDGYLAAELTYSERALWKKRLYELSVETRFDHRLRAVARSGNGLVAHLVNEVTDAPMEVVCDQVIVEHGTRAFDDLYNDLRGRSLNDGVTDLEALLQGTPQPKAGQGNPGEFYLHRIGDAVASRNIHSAVLDAYRLCRTL